MKEPLLLSILLILPIFTMALGFFFRKKDTETNGDSNSVAHLSTLWPMLIFSFIATILGKRLGAPLTFMTLASLPILLFLPVHDRSDPILRSRRTGSLLIIFFSTGFLISPDGFWATLFWEGLLTALLLSGTFGKMTKVNDVFRTNGLPFPLFTSALLFPASMWLAGTLPGQHLHVSLLSFIAGIVSLAIFLPSAPFMNWLILFPDEKLVARSFFQRIAIWLVAADGICRFILPQETLSGKDYLLSQGHPTILAILLVSFTLLAQIQGVALAWTEPVLLRRLYDLAFSQSTLLLTAIYLGGKDRTTILILLAVTLIVCSVTIAMPLLHIEQQTRHRTLSSLGGLLINMPRTGILMAMGTIAFAGFPGFAMASAFAFFSFAGWTIAPLLLTLLLVTLAGILLGRTLGSLFLGEDPKASFRPRDLSPWSFTLGIMLLIPLSILAFHPPGSSGGGFQQTELKQIISVKTGPPK
jgi:hypothetical protein